MPASPPEVTTADLSSADSTTELFRAAIGPVNPKYYLSRFARFEAADRASASWNWAAAFSTLSWLAFRQLWLGALAYAGAVVGAILLVFGIGRLVFQFSEGVELGLVMGFAIAAFAVPGLYGNTLLYAACRKKMAAALAQNATVPEACTMLAKRAPTLLRALVLALVLALASVAVFGTAVAAYFELPHPGKFPYNLGKKADPEADAALPGAAAPVPPEPLQAPLTEPPPVAASASDVPAAVPPAVADAASTPQTATADTASPPAAPTIAPTVTPTPAPSATAATTTPATSPITAPVAPVATTPPPPAVVVPVPSAPAAPTAVVKTAPAKPKDAKASPSKAKPAPEKTAATPKAATQQQARFYVNVGLFADSNNALNAYVKLTDAGLPALKQEFNTSKGKRTRVRVGPYDTEGETQTAIEKVRALGLEAIILRPEKPPEKP